MADTTKDIDTRRREKGISRTIPVAASTKLYAGALVGVNAAGYAVKGSDTASIMIVGRASAQVDNSAGAAGDLSIVVETGVFEYAMSAAAAAVGYAIYKTNQGKVYVDDDQTIGLAADAANSIVAGWAVEIDPVTGKLWVAVGMQGL